MCEMIRNEIDVDTFFFNDTATTEIYTMSLHDALPISLQLLILTEQMPGLKESMNGGGVDNETKNEYENYV